MKNIIGVDIGATKILFVLLSKTKVRNKIKIKTPKTKKELLKALLENIKELKGSLEIEKVGIGVPGILDKKRETILYSPNLKFLKNFALVKVLEKELGTDVLMENDANCFTLAEALRGAGKNKNAVFGLTLGSGAGGGLVIKNPDCKFRAPSSTIYRGACGGAGEIGHMSIKFDGARCSCGSYGCFELYASEKFFQRKKVFSKTLEQKAKQDSKPAQKIFKEYGGYLGIGLANVINLLEPDIIVIGGGMSNAAKYFLKQAETEAKKRIISPLSKKNLRIKLPKLGENAGAVGAALL